MGTIVNGVVWVGKGVCAGCSALGALVGLKKKIKESKKGDKK
jgi:hypothetical protein